MISVSLVEGDVAAMASLRIRPATAGLVAGQGWDSLQFRVIFGLSFFAHLAVAAGRRIDPRFWLEPAGRRSLLAEAWSASATTARMAFAG